MSERTCGKAVFCEVCAEKFAHIEGRVPRVLSCGHTFCESCIEKLDRKIIRKESKLSTYLQNFRVSCPRCKNRTTIEGNITALPKNYSFLDLIEEVCENRKKMCAEHQDYVLDMFCHDDSQAICLKCAIYGEHRTHCYSRLSEFCNHKKTSMKYQIDSAECLLRDCQRLREHVEAKQTELENTIKEIEESVTAIFTSIQHEIKETLDVKLKSVLDDLERCSESQTTILDENLTALNVDELERLKDKATSFLENASEYEIAKETALPDDIQACLDEVPIRKLHTQLKYELKIDSCQHIVETMKDLINEWNCQVTETEKLTTEDVSSVLEKHSPSIEGSISVLFGEKETAATTDSPFEGIDFTYEIP